LRKIKNPAVGQLSGRAKEPRRIGFVADMQDSFFYGPVADEREASARITRVEG
jgi:hypothetical protein